MTEPIGASKTPRNTIEQAADAGLDAAKAHLEKAGAKLREGYISLHATGIPELRDSVSAGHGLNDPRDVFAYLVTEAMAVGRELGITLKILPLKGPLGKG